jgi:nucleoid-associated protein YgaU
VQWGKLVFPCRLLSVTIKYTSFDRDGTPLRAELAVQFIFDEEAERRTKGADQQSPDLTHSRVVRSGDTLPLLTKQIYGSSAAYLDVARFNGLDDFRRLTPGQELLFPPLATFGRSASGRS